MTPEQKHKFTWDDENNQGICKHCGLKTRIKDRVGPRGGMAQVYYIGGEYVTKKPPCTSSMLGDGK